MSNFKQDYLAGKIKYDDIVDYISDWHKSNSNLDLLAH